jgi:hypothetical protein
MKNTAELPGGKPIAVWWKSLSGVNAVDPLVTFYDIRGRKGEVIIIIIRLLMFPLLGHRPSLWITHKENGPWLTTQAPCGLVCTNDCKYRRDQRLNVPFKARRISRYQFFFFIFVTHPMTDQWCLASAIVRWARWPRGHRAPRKERYYSILFEGPTITTYSP